MSAGSERPVSLLDEARALVRKPGSTCAVAFTRRSHPDLVPELDEAIAADLPASAIARALEARGVELRYQSINRHRRGDCACHVTR